MSDKPNRYQNKNHTLLAFRGDLSHLQNQSTLSRYIYNHNHINITISCMTIPTIYHDPMHYNHNLDNVIFYPKRVQLTLMQPCNPPPAFIHFHRFSRGKHEMRVTMIRLNLLYDLMEMDPIT